MATADEIKKFEQDGYVVLEGFLNDADVDALKKECSGLIDKMDPAEHQTVFSTTKQSYRNNYFIDSGDKIRYFFEDGALDEKGNLAVEKDKSLNKIAHALHLLSPNFKRVTHSEKVKKLAKQLDFKEPSICQSMYIFKQPKIGGKVICHQDATYLYAGPDHKLVGVWIALEDATTDNGCLYFQPGSHKNGLLGDYRMVRNPDPEGKQSCVYQGKEQEYDQDAFIPVPVKKGDCIVIDGLVVHKSEQNLSQNSRHIYTFHVYDKAGSPWSDKNWLQPTNAGNFTDLYKTDV